MRNFVVKYLAAGRDGLNKTAQYCVGTGFFISVVAGFVFVMVK